MTALLSLLGRLALALIFVVSALGKIASPAATAALMTSKGMPIAPLFLVGAIVLELGGGLSVLAGYKTRWGALALIVFLIPATLIFHDFWDLTGPEAMDQQLHFLKNISILGGLVLLFAAGPGRLSLDARRARG